ncbi:hypothetical protein MNB_SV-12-61 [hydrothermal vent metagenome]|uniref:Uncharacterized protein n=1 Tax=hydrothermal vent metagenome TaxID=652676 RepID=A0A1W1C5Z3_9ZZZZ
MNPNQNSILSQLKDIKPIVEVHSNSFYIFMAIIALVVLVVAFIAYKYFTRIQKTKQPSPKELAYNRLQNLDFNNIKEVVYRFSLDGSLFCNEKNQDEFMQIEKALESHKYKREVEPLSSELKERIKEFIKTIKLTRGDKK